MKNIFLALILALTSVQAIAQKKASETGYGTQNFIINGDMTFWQRGASIVSPANANYVADRFKYYKATTATHTVGQSTDVPTLAQSKHASQYSMALTLTTPQASFVGSDYVGVAQFIEGTNWAQFAGRPFTISFWVKATLSGTYGLTLGNVSGTQSYVTSYAVAASDTWQKVSVTFPSPTTGSFPYDYGTGLIVYWTIATGPTYITSSLNQWISGVYWAPTTQVNGVQSGATNFKLAQVMLNTGDRAAPFALAGGDVQGELAKVQRYTYAIVGNSAYSRYAFCQVWSSSAAHCQVHLPVAMRGAVILDSAYSGAGSFALSQYTGGTAAIGSMPVNSYTPNLVTLDVGGGGGLNPGDVSELVSNNATGVKLIFSSEL